MRTRSRVSVAVAAVLALSIAGCGRGSRTGSARARPLPPIRLAADSSRVDTLAAGLAHHTFFIGRGPWAIHVLDADRSACWTPIAVKAGDGGAIGRERTSALLARAVREGERVGGGVNADFFLFTPPGVPQSAHVSAGYVIAGPTERPVFAVDSVGRTWIGVLSAVGMVRSGRDTLRLGGWNRYQARGLAYFDRAWGGTTDTASGLVEVAVRGRRQGPVAEVDATTKGVEVPRDGFVVVAGRDASSFLRSKLLAMRAGTDSLTASVALSPIHPREAVGGFPVLVRDSAEVEGLDAMGGERFGPVRHPRTVVGVGAGGRRLLLVVVDGRQPGYSEGMTLRETAALMRDLGAREALNLDGGGSSTLVVSRGGQLTVTNRPSDRDGERPVANALALTCAGS